MSNCNSILPHNPIHIDIDISSNHDNLSSFNSTPAQFTHAAHAAANMTPSISTCSAPPAPPAPPAIDMNQYVVFVAAKGGMDAVNRAHINSIVYESSKNSAHFKHSQTQIDKVSERINKMKKLLAQFKYSCSINPIVYENANNLLQKKLIQWEQDRDLTQYWVTVDMDMYIEAIYRDNNVDEIYIDIYLFVSHSDHCCSHVEVLCCR